MERELLATTFVWCLNGMVGERWFLKLMLPDNKKTFSVDQIKYFNTRKEIIWLFNVAKYHWWAGIFERLTISSKQSLRKDVSYFKLIWFKVSHYFGTDQKINE